MDGPRDCHTEWSGKLKHCMTSLICRILNDSDELTYKTEADSQGLPWWSSDRLHTPNAEAGVQSLARELDPTCNN